MSMLFGSGSKQKPQYTGMQVQSSSNIVPVPLGWGMNRVAPNLIGWWDFASHPAKTAGGKGGGGKAGGSYDYTAAVAMALCHGVSGGVNNVYVDQDKNSTLTKLNLVFFDGSDDQLPWSYLTTNHPSDALNYPGIVYCASPKYDLGSSNTLPQHSFELKMRLYGTSPNGIDADVALVIQDYLTMPIAGCLFPSSAIDTTTLLSGPDAGTTGDNAAQTYCTAMGFGMSPLLVDQEEALTTLKRWCDIFNIAPVFNGYILKFVPYALDTVTGHGVTYLPSTDPAFTLTDADFITSNDPSSEGNDPIVVSRKDPMKIKNRLQMEILSRDKEYNPVPIEYVEQGLVDQYGDLPDNVFTAHEVCDPTISTACVALMVQRNAFWDNNIFKFTLPPSFCILEPIVDFLDIIDPQMGTITVQVQKMTEDDNFNIAFECTQVMFGSTDSGGFNPPDQTSTGQNTGVDPDSINTPIIFQPSASLTNGVPQIWAAVSGGSGGVADSNWGGCNVWVSTDGATYAEIGSIPSPARMGVTTSALAAFGGTNPDTADTVGVNLAESAGSLVSVSDTDAANNATLCYLDGELLSFRDATLVSSSNYTLGGKLFRGLYDTTAGAHVLGVPFARLDDNIFKYDLPMQYVGQTLYFKFQSFNVYGQATQDLSTCTAYAFTPSTPVAVPGKIDNTGVADGDSLKYDAASGTWVPGPPAVDPWSVTATGTGASQNITLPVAVTDAAGVLVFVNGIRFETSEYTITGTTLTLTTNAAGDLIEVIGLVS